MWWTEHPFFALYSMVRDFTYVQTTYSKPFRNQGFGAASVGDEQTQETGAIIFDDTNPNNALLWSKISRLAMHLQCLIPPKTGNLVTPDKNDMFFSVFFIAPKYPTSKEPM